jgi:diguanylate cyclase (GGDEF)-like protein
MIDGLFASSTAVFRSLGVSAALEARRGQMRDSELGVEDILLRVEDARAQAAADRVKAAEDRARAAAEREEAARERADALHNRTESAVILKLATTDELTGAWTRKFGLDQIGRELERAHRTGSKLLLAFVDVDGLKQVNDSHGHQAGDTLLHRVGEALRASVRAYDVIVRFGGDEFVCAMPNLSTSEARARFEKIAADLRAVDAEHSISFGLAEAEADDTVKDLLARADAELLRARREPSSEAAIEPGQPRQQPSAAAIAFKAQFKRFAVYVVKQKN